MHKAIAERIVEAAKLPAYATVVEIGPGTGILTRALLAKATKIIGIEADPRLYDELVTTFAEEIALKTFEPLLADIRTFDIEDLPTDYHVVANIPYYLTGEILERFLSARNQPTSMTLLIQKEVAVRIVARPKNPSTHARGKESILSLSVKAYGTPAIAFTVPRGAFIPAPSVDSAVLTIHNISRAAFADLAHEKRFFEYLHAGFGQKRKVLAKNLELSGLVTPKNLGHARAEDVPLALWLSLSR